MNEPRTIPIHRSLNRPHLLLGAERGLVLLCGMVTALLIFVGGIKPLSLLLGIGFWGVSFWAVVQMAKADTQMSKVYQRHVRYRSYYIARGCPHALLTKVPKAHT